MSAGDRWLGYAGVIGVIVALVIVLRELISPTCDRLVAGTVAAPGLLVTVARGVDGPVPPLPLEARLVRVRVCRDGVARWWVLGEGR